MIDLLIAGGGPVGLAAAIEARRLGLTVAVIEPRGTPIDKACGEGLMPGAMSLLTALGVNPAGHSLAGIGYYATSTRAVRVPVPDESASSAGHFPPERALSRGVEHRFTVGPGRGVRRVVLHAALAARAIEVGVQHITGRVDAIEQHDDRVTVGVGRDRIDGAWLLGCDGLHSSVARLSSLARPVRGSGRRYGIRQHFAVPPWSDLVEVHYGPAAELYVTPVADDLVGVAMLAPQGMTFGDALAAVPAIADRVAGAEVVSERRGAGPFHQRTRARTAGRVLLAGDASGYVDALTGEGLRVGFAQASAAVRCISDAEPARYEREWRMITRDFRMITSALVYWATSPARAGIVPAAVRAPALFGAVVDRLAR